MEEFTNINAYHPVVIDSNSFSKSSKILISKEKENGDIDYFCFDVSNNKLTRVDNAIKFVISNNSRSLSKIIEKEKKELLNEVINSVSSSNDINELNMLNRLISKDLTLEK